MSKTIETVLSTFNYLRFFLPLLVGFGAFYLLIIGADWSLTALEVFLAILAIEFVLGNNSKDYEYKYPQVFVGMMYLFMVSTVVTFWAYAWIMAFAHNGSDLFSLAAITQSLTGFDMMTAHMDNNWADFLLATVLLSSISGIAALAVGHELSHRTQEPVSIFLARVGGMLSMFTYYAIEHPYGHHFNVGTPEDSSTAFRGESVFAYFKRTTPQDYETAWEIETTRLEKNGHEAWSVHNRLLRGYSAEAGVIAFLFVVGGVAGVFWFMLAVLNTHFTYKLGTYGQHYGIVRVPGTPIEAHHSWDSSNRFTYWFSNGIGRHVDHHLEPEKEFWELKAYTEGPQYMHGYISSIVLSTVPALWHKLMAPKLLEWDEKWASDDERALAMEANLHSGVPALVAAAQNDYRELHSKAS